MKKITQNNRYTLLPKRFCYGLEGGGGDYSPAEAEAAQAEAAEAAATPEQIAAREATEAAATAETPEQIAAREAAEAEEAQAEIAEHVSKAIKISEQFDSDINTKAAVETGENLDSALNVRMTRVENGGAFENFPATQEAVAAYQEELSKRLEGITGSTEA